METVLDPRQAELDALLASIRGSFENANNNKGDIDNKTNEVTDEAGETPDDNEPPEVTQSIVGAVLAFYSVAKSRIVQNSDEEDQRKANGQSYITKSQFKALVTATNAYRKVVDELDEVLQNTWVQQLDQLVDVEQGISSDPVIAACQNDFINCNNNNPGSQQCDINYLECLESHFEDKLDDDIEAIEAEENEEN